MEAFFGLIPAAAARVLKTSEKMYCLEPLRTHMSFCAREAIKLQNRARNAGRANKKKRHHETRETQSVEMVGDSNSGSVYAISSN